MEGRGIRERMPPSAAVPAARAPIPLPPIPLPRNESERRTSVSLGLVIQQKPFSPLTEFGKARFVERLDFRHRPAVEQSLQHALVAE